MTDQLIPEQETAYQLITTDEALKTACSQLSLHKIVAVDTEFKRETTYFPIPCLFQLASADMTICIDPFQIEDLTPLKALFDNEDILKIFHAGRQDLEIFYYLFQSLPTPIFDTQVAASILGFPAQVGYAKLVSDYLGIELDKSLTRADWEKRPLPEKQLDYAANDVIYLLQVYEKQIEALTEAGRLNWPVADNENLLDEDLYRPSPTTAWKKMRNYNYLSVEERRIAAALAQWREEQAIAKDRPRKYIFDNPIISELANHKPASLDELKSLKNIPAFVTRKYSETLLDIIEVAVNSDEQLEDVVFQRLSEEQGKIVKRMQTLIREIAEKENIEAAVICNKKDLEKLVLGKKELPVLKNWRYEIAGKQLLAMNLDA